MIAIVTEKRLSVCLLDERINNVTNPTPYSLQDAVLRSSVRTDGPSSPPHGSSLASESAMLLAVSSDADDGGDGGGC